MKVIRCLADLDEFAGKIVSFTSKPELSTPEESYSVAEKMFAFVGKTAKKIKGEISYPFFVLYKNDDAVILRRLSESSLSRLGLEAAEVTDDEKQEILRAVLHDESATFGELIDNFLREENTVLNFAIA